MLRAYKIQTQPINTGVLSDSFHIQATRSDGRRLATGQTLSCLAGRNKDPPHRRQVLALTTPSWVKAGSGAQDPGSKARDTCVCSEHT